MFFATPGIGRANRDGTGVNQGFLASSDGVLGIAVSGPDAQAPATTDDVPAGAQAGPVTATLTAMDIGDAGVDRTYYTTGASPTTPTTASAVYHASARPTLADGERIRYFSTDRVGNAEVPHSSVAASVTPVIADAPASGSAPVPDAAPAPVGPCRYKQGASLAVCTVYVSLAAARKRCAKFRKKQRGICNRRAHARHGRALARLGKAGAIYRRAQARHRRAERDYRRAMARALCETRPGRAKASCRRRANAGV